MEVLMSVVKRVLGPALLFASLAATAFAGAEPAKPKKALTEADVLKLVELAVADPEIAAVVRRNGLDFKADDAVLKRLKDAGAYDEVLAARRGDAPPAPAVLASGTHESGTTLEITEIKRTSEGFLQVSFRFRNPTDKPIKLYNGLAFVAKDPTDSRRMIANIYYVEPKSKMKHGVAADDKGALVASAVGGKEVTAPANGVSSTYWVKMAGPENDVDKVTFYFADAPPIEDVPLPPLKK
jgi:hypothetical protein